MKKTASLVLLLTAASALSLLSTGCARPNEIGWTPAYSLSERTNLIARNWDLEGKMMQDDIDSALLLRPVTQLTTWHVR